MKLILTHSQIEISLLLRHLQVLLVKRILTNISVISRLTLSPQKVFIIVFYEAKKGNIIEFGSNTVGNHKILRSTHAEENALRGIYSYLNRTIGTTNKNNNKKISKYISNIKIFIWKQNNSYEIKPVYCCEWCIKTINRYNFPINNVITLNGNYASYCNNITRNITNTTNTTNTTNITNTTNTIIIEKENIENNIIIITDLKITTATMHTHVIPNPLLKRNVKLK